MNGKEVMAMMRAVGIMKSIIESEENDRCAVVSAEFDKRGGLTVKLDGRGDFLVAAMSVLFHELAEKTGEDPEELYYVLCAMNGIKEDIEKSGDVDGDGDEDGPELKIKFNMEERTND